MIQRIQTIFLALAILVNVPVLFMKMADASSNESMESPSIHLYGMRMEKQYLNELERKFVTEDVPLSSQPMLMGHVGVVIAVALLCVGAIFLYKNRPLQLKVVYGTLVLVLVQVLLALKLYMDLPGMIGAAPEDPHDFGFALFLPAAAILLLWAAARRIQADERMVKDMDRIR